MITDYEKFRMQDENGKNDFFVEVNWKPDDPETSDCKILKVTFSNGSEAFVKKEYLNAMLFAIGTAAEQRDLLPQKIVTARKYQTVLGIKAKKNIKAGEMINVQVDIPLPDIEQDIIGEAKRLARTSTITKEGGIIIPTT